jgi:hypothetical protein
LFKPIPKSLLALAVLFTLLDAVKPLMIDDTAYRYYAVQAAEHPLDPYGFAVYWWSRPYVANEVLAPPGLAYWWAPAIRLFGEQPVLWKVWLFPFSFLFIWALHSLCRRFARGLEVLLIWMTVLSPTFLPGLNLMLDVPALALSLAALVLFIHACDRDSYALAGLAGVVAGVAAETKYTGLVVPATMLLYALAFGKLRLWPAAALLAAQIFVSWEMLIAVLYGQSHFLSASRPVTTDAEFWERAGLLLWEKAGLFWPLLANLAGCAPAVVLLSLVGLRARPWAVALAACMSLLGFAMVATLTADFTCKPVLSNSPFFSPFEGPPAQFNLEEVVFGVLGAAGATVVGIVVGRQVWLLNRDLSGLGRWRANRVGLFLVLWVGLELASYFALTPFPAVRRVMGVVLAGTMLAGHLASRTCRTPAQRRLLLGVSVFSGLVGLGFAGLDAWEAWTEKRLVEQAATLARAEEVDRVWFVGHWGFQYYAERAGMQPVVTWYSPGQRWYLPDEGDIPLPPPSELRAGDWLVVPDWRLTQQRLVIDETRTEAVYWLSVSDPVPLRTIMCYYAGYVPLEHRSEPTRLEVQIFRVTADWQPVSRQ